MSISRIGLTGSIGSGKTTVAGRLRMLGAHVLDADEASRCLLGRTGGCSDLIIQRFGKDILNEDGLIDRKALADVVFSDEESRRDLNAIVHPAVFETLEREYARIRSTDAHCPVFFDVPLLFETGYDKYMDRTIVVYADPRTVIRRTVARDCISEEQAMKRLSVQMDQSEKVKRADYVIKNDGTMDELFQEVDLIYRSILKDA